MKWNVDQVRERTAVLKLLDSVPREMGEGEDNSIPFIWSLLGAKPFDYIHFASDDLSPEDCSRVSRAFPEAIVIPVSERMEVRKEELLRDAQRFNANTRNVLQGVEPISKNPIDD